MTIRHLIARTQALIPQHPLAYTSICAAVGAIGLARFLTANAFDATGPYVASLLYGVVFSLLLSATFFVSGLAFLTAGRPNSVAAWLLERYGDHVLKLFAGSGGAIIGLVFGVAFAAAFDDFHRYWMLSLGVMLMALVATCGPLVCAVAARTGIVAFNQRESVAAWRAPAIRYAGMVLVAMGIGFSVQSIYEATRPYI
ncbi:MAG TPA: hypothetical protein VN038_22340 [Dyadobacter sp.]|nr:hypothetical protein [Dyadobacter sp.]